jgi:DNA topoisomerase I
LRKRHASVRGDRVRFEFHGKARRSYERRSSTPSSPTRCASCSPSRAERGSFRFEREGETTILTGELLNTYVVEHLGEGFTTKDFRTWGGTLTAAVELAQHEPAATAAEERRILAAVMRHVGRELGNTPAVARSSYVSPAVVELWHEGRLAKERFPKSRTAVVRTHRAALSREEKALLTLLRSWRSRRARAGR